MTTYRLYRCNLCNDYIAPSDATSKEGFGVFFTGSKAHPINLRRPDESEKHVCMACAKAVHDELRKVMPAPILGVTQS